MPTLIGYDEDCRPAKKDIFPLCKGGDPFALLRHGLVVCTRCCTQSCVFCHWQNIRQMSSINVDVSLKGSLRNADTPCDMAEIEEIDFSRIFDRRQGL
ncbi:hypothetical protein NC651_023294 [Populus alba x Populus x berolinensis]|nr:hypothetical protein NC651_023294 [Populus alba x Populus x berolinensis]